jgi:hypothetical protein
MRKNGRMEGGRMEDWKDGRLGNARRAAVVDAISEPAAEKALIGYRGCEGDRKPSKSKTV